ncbi:hypothetical protein G7Y89_g13592 [Cudoniella acicularis]|uniref:Uncharacterized protein n=1 Tax=Cudoniella acicularis TaxID=354080 RepID=A0A8H4R7Y2_9HELO|nr:hypothetical protein G7Y89_g13592 [Cudoniella acicularis]
MPFPFEKPLAVVASEGLMLDTNPANPSTWHVHRQGPMPRMVLLCKLLIVSSSIFSILAFATDDDILDTSIYGITFNCRFCPFVARDGTSTSRAVCKLWNRRNNEAALLTYREVVYDIDLTKIKFQDGVLCLYQNQRPITARSKRGLFPGHLTTNIEHREAALANNQCTTAMALLGRLTRKLLEGVASTIEVLDLHVGKPLIPTKLVPGPDSSGLPHTVLKVVRLFANEAWIIDTAGCQYGFRDVLVPFEKYVADKSCRISSEPTTYDATETKDLDYFSTLPFLNRTRAQREDKKLERQARLHFAIFVNTLVSKDMLNGSATEFKDKFDSFVYELKLHMLNLAN